MYGLKCLRSDLLGSMLFNSLEYLSLLVSHDRSKYYFGNQRLMQEQEDKRLWVGSGSAMEECPCGAHAEPFGFLI